MPQVQFINGRDRREVAATLAGRSHALRDERRAGSDKEGRVKRLCELAQEWTAVCVLCYALFWIVREVLVIAG